MSECQETNAAGVLTTRVSNLTIFYFFATFQKQCDQQKCRGQNNFYIYPSEDSSLNGFCKCESEVGVFVDCPEDSVYDPVLNVCKLNNVCTLYCYKLNKKKTPNTGCENLYIYIYIFR